MNCPYCRAAIGAAGAFVCPDCGKPLPMGTTGPGSSSVVSMPSAPGDLTAGSAAAIITGAATSSAATSTSSAEILASAKAKIKKAKRKKLKRKILSHRVTLFVIILMVLYHVPVTAPFVQPPVDDTINSLKTLAGLADEDSYQYMVIPQSTSFVFERKISITTGSSGSQFDAQFTNFPNTPKTDTTTWGKTYQNLKNFSYDVKQGEGYVDSSTTNLTNVNFVGDVPAGQDVEIVLSYTVESHAVDWKEKVSRSNSGTVDDIPQELKDQYNHDERFSDDDGVFQRFIEVDANRNLTEFVTRGETTVYGQLEAIYDYILENIAYSVNPEVNYCNQILARGDGDCDDMAGVFLSLARGVGIPSWMVFGHIAHNEEFSSWETHSWVEAYVPLKDGTHLLGHSPKIQ